MNKSSFFWSILLLFIATDNFAEASPSKTMFEFSEDTICTGDSTAVVLIVDPQLITQIRTSLTGFETDLCGENYTVIEKVSNFTTPVEVRNYLHELYVQTDGNLEGAIFIGDIPWAYQSVKLVFSNPNIPPLVEEVISFQFYSDLDGTFAASPDYTSPGSHPFSYDLHTGDLDWEIWTSILPYYKGSLSRTIDAINQYFAKNHLYRTGGYTLPHAFLQITEHHSASTINEHNLILSSMRTGIYSWTPLSNTENARLYFDSPPGGLSVEQGYADLSSGVADFTVLDAHGSSFQSGKLTIPWIESNPVKTAFFWSNGCAVGNLDVDNNFLTSVVYSPTSQVVVAKGTTNNSGGMGNNQNGFFGHNIAVSLLSGANFGQSILSHINVPLLYPWSDSREFHFATSIMIGDLTLKLRPSKVTSVHSDFGLPLEFTLYQNFPNPFNPVTTISFNLPQPGYIKMTVYDLLGREIVVLASGDFPSGRFQISWDASAIPSGIYIYKIQAGFYSESKKMLLLK